MNGVEGECANGLRPTGEMAMLGVLGPGLYMDVWGTATVAPGWKELLPGSLESCGGLTLDNGEAYDRVMACGGKT